MLLAVLVVFAAAATAMASEYTLPDTGGMGTLLFTIGGTVLVGLALIVILIPKKKKDSDETENTKR